MAIDKNAGTGVTRPAVNLSPDQKQKSNLNPGTNEPMKRIPVNWLCDAEAVVGKVAIHIRSTESHIDSILQNGVRDTRSLSQIQKLNMEHLRQWEKFPVRILRSL
jgi:hypothetical protein